MSKSLIRSGSEPAAVLSQWMCGWMWNDLLISSLFLMGTYSHCIHRNYQSGHRCAHLLNLIEKIQNLNRKRDTTTISPQQVRHPLYFNVKATWEHHEEICIASAHLQHVVKINNLGPWGCPHLETLISTKFTLRKRRMLSHTDYNNSTIFEFHILPTSEEQCIVIKQDFSF